MAKSGGVGVGVALALDVVLFSGAVQVGGDVQWRRLEKSRQALLPYEEGPRVTNVKCSEVGGKCDSCLVGA